MPLCGWNDDMSCGVNQLIMGLSAQTKKRAQDEGVLVTEIPVIELEEIRVLLEELEHSPFKSHFKGIVGVITLIQFLYMQLKERFECGEDDVDSVFSELTDTLNGHLETMDAHYYQTLRPNYPRLEAIRHITQFLESRVS